ncbi:MAG TPA: DUF429 domain-containing protein, partial [Citricoccus sp.]
MTEPVPPRRSSPVLPPPVPSSPARPLRFIGIDLAAAAERTGAAVLVQDPRSGRLMLEQALLGADDDVIVELVSESDKAGVDVPFGWPEPFVRLVAGHRAGTLTPAPESGPSWRRELALRTTDRAVQELTGLTPLSVSTDRIAYPALRWANLAARMRAAGVPVEPDGAGVACEVYPAAALRTWGLPFRAYKKAGREPVRTDLVAALTGRLPHLDLAGHTETLVAQDDVLDALVSALVAREVYHGNSHLPDAAHLAPARREGWVHVPAGPPT